MIKIRKSKERGHANHGWLESYHSFSFADYYDPEQMGFRSLRVINEDWIEHSQGFDTHGHRDMEIITYLISGTLSHKDSMGNGSIIHPGEIQYMSAGTGVTHSEFNPSDKESCHLLQIWIKPDHAGYSPTYAQNKISEVDRNNKLCLIASNSGENGSIQIRQDAKLFSCKLDPGSKTEYHLSKNRHTWIQVVQGNLIVNGHTLVSGDALAMSDEESINLLGVNQTSEFLLFDLN